MVDGLSYFYMEHSPFWSLVWSVINIFSNILIAGTFFGGQWLQLPPKQSCEHEVENCWRTWCFSTCYRVSSWDKDRTWWSNIILRWFPHHFFLYSNSCTLLDEVGAAFFKTTRTFNGIFFHFTFFCLTTLNIFFIRTLSKAFEMY